MYILRAIGSLFVRFMAQPPIYSFQGSDMFILSRTVVRVKAIHSTSDFIAQSGLDNSDFIISCVDEGKTVGCARIFWDKGYIAYLADVIVNPEYQGQGIGKKMVQECIKYIDNQLKEGWRIKIVIVASKGKEAFYEKLGFKARPNDNDGPGMDMWRE